MVNYYPLLIAFLLLANVSIANAQSKAFESISVGAYVGYPVAGGELLNSWNSEPSLQLSFGTPFYAGELETGVRYTRFSNSEAFPDYSNFDSFFIYMGWGYHFTITDKLSAGPALRFGTTFFKYDEAKIYTRPNVGWEYDFDTTESEFAYELLFRSVFRISGRIRAHAELTYNRTLTFHPVRLSYISAGFTYRFNSPDWFKKVLR